MDFPWLDGLDGSMRERVLFSIRAVWTQESCTIEGNALSRRDVRRWLRDGRTATGRTLQEHLDVKGHSDAVERLLAMAADGVRMGEEEIFALHRMVMQTPLTDVYRPIGAWKREDNGTMIEDGSGRPVWREYPPWIQTPRLMARWIREFAELSPETPAEALACCAWAHLSFVAIHPFFDGNGRMARLLSNYPLLLHGFPPVIIRQAKREEYVGFCRAFQNRPSAPFPEPEDCRPFAAFLSKQWGTARRIIGDARRSQARLKAAEGASAAEAAPLPASA